ncbi:MAG: GDP-L-fucose synthase [Candidatus Methanofastidiosa archaeon]|jgi:GDP-L-fucose synthase|nr:GDP-L-fucose synthase [Candidatus Methanofastidiosa archaeon]
MRRTSKIYVAGHNGLVGSAIVRKLKDDGHKNIMTFSHDELDLTDKNATETMFRLYKPSYVFMAAAKVGGIHANNTQSGEFFYQNIMIQTNVIEAARKYGTKKLLFLGSSCIYPKECPQPIKEEYLMTAPLEITNSGYATAKIAGIEMCKSYRRQWGCNFISVMPCNLYGVGDNFSLMNSHVLPALIRKFHEAKLNGIPQVEVWGDGTPKREFLYVDDLAEALIFLMHNYNEPGHINVGAGYDVPINFLVKMIKDIIGYKGEIVWNKSYPNGTMQKLMDSSKIKELGWEPKIDLEQGIKETYKWFVENYNNIRV